MKLVVRFLPVLALVVIGCAPGAPPDPPVTVRSAEGLAPQDLGIGKYVFEVTPPAGKLLCIRLTETEGAKRRSFSEVIVNAKGGPARDTVLVYDSRAFPFSEGKESTVKVRASGAGLAYAGWVTRMSMHAGRLTLDVTREAGGVVRLEWESSVEDYAAVKARVPKLPPVSEEWLYGNSLGRD